MRGALLLAVILVAAPLAGCVGSGGGPSSGPDAGPAEADDGEDQGSPDAGDAEGTEVTTATFDVPNATQTIRRNDTFAPQDSCVTGGCVTGDARHTTDITEIVPTDAPARVYLNVTYEGLPIYQPVGAWFSAEDVTFYGYSSSFDSGSIQIEALMVRAEAGTVEAVVQLGAPGPSTEPDPNTDYTLEVTAVPVTSRIDRGVPVEAQLSPGQTIEATTAGQDTDADELAFRVYGPDDTAVAYVSSDDGSATWTVPENASAGTYALANTWTSDVELSTPGGASLRALTIDWTYSEPTTYEGTGAVTWSFDVDRDPLWAGIYVQDSDILGGLNGPTFTATGFDATLTLPGGETAGGSWDCTICINSLPFFGGAHLGFGPARADPGLVAGTYEAELSADASLGYEYGHVVAHYVR